MTVQFFAAGKPEPQGSMKGFVVADKRTGKSRAILTSDNTKLKPWRWSVTYAATEAMARAGLSGQLFDGAVSLSVEFVMPAPQWVQAKHRRQRFPPCVTKPDLSKLVRALEDALTGIVFKDDALVVRFGHMGKRYAVGAEEPGAHVHVTVDDTVSAPVPDHVPLFVPDEDPTLPDESLTQESTR